MSDIKNGRYSIEKKLGEGGMSEVYLVRDTVLNKKWALKRVRNDGDDIYRQSVYSELSILKKLDNAALPRIVDLFSDDEYVYAVMDYIEGHNLEQLMNEGLTFTEKEVVDIGVMLCDVFIYLHSEKPPIIYRDLKPANIILNDDGRVRLIDFGIAREYKYSKRGDTVCLGTRGYAAPEQFGGDGQTDERTDIYCLGATLYHLVTGKNPSLPPYRIYPIRFWNKALSSGLEYVIGRCTETNPNDRYGSMEQVKADLLSYRSLEKSYRFKKILKTFIVSVSFLISLSFLLFSYISKELEKYAMTREYEDLITRADFCTDDYKRRMLILSAIEINKKDEESYLRLTDAYKGDGVFGSDEEKEIRNLYEETDFPESGLLEYEIASLYRYYYPGEAFDSLLASAPWYESARKKALPKEKKRKAELLINLSHYVDNVSKKLDSELEPGEHGLCYPYLLRAVALEEDSKSEEEILETLRLADNLINNSYYNFLDDGISERSILECVVRSEKLLRSMESSDPKIESGIKEIYSVLTEIRRKLGDENE